MRIVRSEKLWQALALLLVIIFFGCRLIPRRGISQECCDEIIQYGWSRGEVEGLLGEPMPQKVETRGITSITYFSMGGVWRDEDGNEIHVCFYGPGYSATSAEFIPSKLSFFEKIKGRIERRFPAIF